MSTVWTRWTVGPRALLGAPHLAPDREVEVPAAARAAWEAMGGGELEESLLSSQVVLVDAAWLIGLSSSGGKLPPRQALPPEAVLSPSEAVAACRSRPPAGSTACCEQASRNSSEPVL